MSQVQRYDFVYTNDFGNEYPAYERLEVDGEYVTHAAYAALQLELTTALADAAMWKNNHDNMVDRAKLLRDRLDMPVERIKAFERLGVLQARNAELSRYIVKADALLDELGCPLDEVIDLFEAQTAPAKDEHCSTCARQNSGTYCDCREI